MNAQHELLTVKLGAKKRRSKLQIESKRDSLGLFQNLDNKGIRWRY